MKVKPEDVDNLSKEKKDKFYSLLDKCWDEDENKVPDSCPIDSVKNEENLNEGKWKEVKKGREYEYVVAGSVVGEIFKNDKTGEWVGGFSDDTGMEKKGRVRDKDLEKVKSKVQKMVDP